MVEVRSILVPTDFSGGAELALDQAIALARRKGSWIRLLHCYRLPTEVELVHLDDSRAERWECEIRSGAAHLLAQFAARVEAEGIAVTQELACGNAAAEIVRAASSDVSLLVMGALGRTAHADAQLGSVVERTVRDAPCPILVVRSQRQQAELPRTVVVPIHGPEALERSPYLPWRHSHSKSRGRVVLVYAHDVEDLAAMPPAHRASLSSALRRSVRERLDALAAEVRRAGLRCEVRIASGDPAHLIAECAREQEADWLVLDGGDCSAADGSSDGVAERALRLAPCSVLVLRWPCTGR